MFNFFSLLSQAKVRVTPWARVGLGLPATSRQHPRGATEHQEWHFLGHKVPNTQLACAQ